MLQFRRNVVDVAFDERLYSIVGYHPSKPFVKDIIRAFNVEGAVDAFVNKHMAFFDLTADLQQADLMVSVKELTTYQVTGSVVETGT